MSYNIFEGGGLYTFIYIDHSHRDHNKCIYLHPVI